MAPSTQRPDTTSLPRRGDKSLQLENICSIMDSLVHLPPHRLASSPLRNLLAEDLLGAPPAAQGSKFPTPTGSRALDVECPSRFRHLRLQKSLKLRRNQNLLALVGSSTPITFPPNYTPTQIWRSCEPLADLRAPHNYQRLRLYHRFWWTHGVRGTSSKRYVLAILRPSIPSPHLIS